MRLIKFSLIGLLTFSSGLILSGCGGTLAGTNTAVGTGTLAVSSSTVDFGQVAVGKTVSSSVTVSNKGSAAIEISQLNLTGQSFSLGAGNSLPITVGGNDSITFTLQFDPAASGPASGQLTIASNAAKRFFGISDSQRHGRAGSHRADMRERIDHGSIRGLLLNHFERRRGKQRPCS